MDTLYSYNLANAILIIALIIAVFTSALAATKLIPETRVSKSGSVTGDKSAVGDELFIGSPISPVYSISLYLLPISWGAVAGVLIWRGRIRSIWTKQGYDYDIFKLVARMKGSHMRIRLLGLVDLPKNKMQLAKELGVDWKTIDNHVDVLIRNGLIEELAHVGNSKYYVLSEHGKRVLSLLSSSEKDNHDNQQQNS